MTKRKYDDICTPTDAIFKRCRVTNEHGITHEELHRTDGYEIQFCGRKIGVHKNDLGFWCATDMKTGMKINPYCYSERGYLINFLLKNIKRYMEIFSDEKLMKDLEVRFTVLMREQEGN